MHKINEVKLTLYNPTEEHAGSMPGRVLDPGMRGKGFAPHGRHCIVE